MFAEYPTSSIDNKPTIPEPKNDERPAEQNRRLIINDCAERGAAKYANSRLATEVNTSDRPIPTYWGN